MKQLGGIKRGEIVPTGILPWIKLLAGMVVVFSLTMGLGVLSGLIPEVQRMARVIEEHDIRATAIFYTDFETSAESSEYIRHSLEYKPVGRTQP